MARHIVVKEGKVVNIIELEPGVDFTLPGCTITPDEDYEIKEDTREPAKRSLERNKEEKGV